MSNIIFIITVFILIIALLSLVPYRKSANEQFEMDVSLKNMTCEDVLKSTSGGINILQTVINNDGRKESLSDLLKASVLIKTPDGDVLPGSDYCLITNNMKKKYLMDNCRLGGFQLINTGQNFQPDGCVINPNDSWFGDFLDSGFYYKHKKLINEINFFKTDNERLRGVIKVLEAEKKSQEENINNLNNQKSNLNNEISGLNTAIKKTNTEIRSVRREISNSRPIVTPSQPSIPQGIRTNTRHGERCGPTSNSRCMSGECCSIHDWCGSGIDHCWVHSRKDINYHGEGVSKRTTTPPPPPPPPQGIRTNTKRGDKCGPTTNSRCMPGECCSTHDWCGSDNDHCVVKRRQDTNIYHGVGVSKTTPPSSVTIDYRSEDTSLDGLPEKYAPGFAYVPDASFTQYITKYAYFKVNGGPSLRVIQRYPGVHFGKDVIKYGPIQQNFKSYTMHKWTFHN
uniref:Chitin-binding type-1 domain-containing protein n=1 Tax=viral metagenome TaxID=1070528 RepID=A0A6C0BGY5_9ZZZZ